MMETLPTKARTERTNTMSDQPTHYEILGVTRDASAEQIKGAYRRLARELHPDHHPGDADKERRFKAVVAAYEVVGHDESRRGYDLKLALGDALAANARRAEEAVRRARDVEQRKPKSSSLVRPSSTAALSWGDLLVGLASVGIGALMLGGTNNGRSHWDSNVQRRRGVDGRFRRSRRSDRRRLRTRGVAARRHLRSSQRFVR
jgi:curved DNA-binding protein CbpA